MAQKIFGETPDFDLREAEEIERLLREEEERAEEKKSRIHPLKKFLNRKLFLGLTVAFLLIWGVSWGVLSLMERSPDTSQVSSMNQAPAKDSILSSLQIQKPNIYPLDPFFVPIPSKNKKAERFLHVTVHLVLSNRRLRTDIDKVQPLIRQSVYAAISRKKLKDFDNGRVKVEERIKREILTASNSFLLSGTGTITNVIFTEFIVSPS
jgi:flagellar basal body-associated protein FliL